jgi:peroxiredoxin
MISSARRISRLLYLLAASAGLLAASSGALAAPAIAESAAAARPLAVGATAPSVVVKTPEGADFDLGAALAEKPTVLVFYRGGWCPYCNRQLAELAAFEPKFLALGFQIIAVCTDAPAGLAATTEKDKIAYRLFSDRGMAASAAYGVAFRVPAAMAEKYRSNQIELAPVPGEAETRWLLVPTVFVIGRDRVVRFMSSNPDFKVRLPASEVLDAARTALSAAAK